MEEEEDRMRREKEGEEEGEREEEGRGGGERGEAWKILPIKVTNVNCFKGLCPSHAKQHALNGIQTNMQLWRHFDGSHCNTHQRPNIPSDCAPHTQRLYALTEKAMYISAHQKKQYLCAYTPWPVVWGRSLETKHTGHRVQYLLIQELLYLHCVYTSLLFLP